MLVNELIIGKATMFLTWQLWNALHFPMWRHPIFNYARRQSVSSEASPRLWRVLQLVAILCIILFAIVFPVPAIVSTLGLALGIPLLLILFNGTVLGTIWVTGISISIAAAHENNRFDLMSIAPRGALGASWLLCTGVVHRHNWLRIVYRIVRWVLTVILILLALAIVMLIFGAMIAESERLQQQQVNVLRDVINISLIICALWLDHIQSIVVAATLGITLPTIIKDKTQLRGIAPIIYLMIQLCSYLAIFITYHLIDIIVTAILGKAFIVAILIPILSLFTFYVMRETIIGILWRLMLIKYDASLDDYQRAVRA